MEQHLFWKRSLLISSLLLLLAVSLPLAVSGQRISDYVVDQAGIFSAKTREQATSFLRQLEQDTSVQMVIYTTKSIPADYDLESYTLKIAEENGIGQKGNDNGILFFLATEDRKYRWEVGYGLEDVLNTPLLGRVSRVYLVPAFKAGNFAQGTLDGVEVVSRILRNSTDEDIMRLKEPLVSRPVPSMRIIFILLVMMFFLLLPLFMKGRKGRLSDAHYYGAGWLLFSGGFGRGLGGFGGSGGFGGFSGGGGGFGGGGFSGGF
ncbi:MAG: TPM domain-containing protein [DPANN group archaeon]|nr:TPM domain-containing protein [DPANN group archaeon]